METNVKVGDVVIFKHSGNEYIVTVIEFGIGGSVYGRCKEGYCMGIGSNQEIYDIVVNTIKKNCDQCSAAVINGLFCHETGCPNSKKNWNGEAWVTVYDCAECGSEIPEGEACTCLDSIEDEIN